MIFKIPAPASARFSTYLYPNRLLSQNRVGQEAKGDSGRREAHTDPNPIGAKEGEQRTQQASKSRGQTGNYHCPKNSFKSGFPIH